MDISFLAVGRLKGPEQELCDRYLTRSNGMGRQLGIGKCLTFEVSEGRARTARQRQNAEAEALLKKLADRAVLIALDERGKTYSSQKFSGLMAKYRDDGVPSLVFALGGPDGHGEAVLQKAQVRLSLSAMTMPHGIARAVLFEQVYRALTILGNHPYHRE